MRMILVVLGLLVAVTALAADTSEVVNKAYMVTKVRVNSVTLNFSTQETGVSCSMLDAQGREIKGVSLVDDASQWNKWGGTLTGMGQRALSLCRAQEGISK